MPSTLLFIAGTVFLSLNFVRLFGLAISDWFYFGAMALALIETARFDQENFRCWTRNRFLGIAGLILFGAILSTSHALFINAAVVEIFQQLYVVTLFISLIWIMVRRGKIDMIVKAFIWSGVFTACIAIIDAFAGTHFGPQLSGTPGAQFWGRYAGSLGHPNKLGYYLVITSILSISKFVEISIHRPQMMTRLLWGSLILIQVFGMYLSGSMTAYLGFLLGSAALVAYSKTLVRQIVRYVMSTALLGVPTLLFGMIFINVSLPDTLSLENSLISTAFNRVGTSTAYSRWYIFQEALESISENPIVGAGYDQVSTSAIGTNFRQLNGTVHNMLLQNWYVGGFFVFLGWLLIYIILGWMAITAAQPGEKNGMAPLLWGIAAAALAILLMDQFQDAIYQREKWLIFGLLASSTWTKGKVGK
ncbi:MAG TPA: O-antigen ligase family protein [Oculatellaceae cyanobacterium]|nr:O-antigen ligase family protein [Anaerolineales bacterium]